MRQRLLEGFLLRLARVRDADAYALRGGMLVNQWLRRRRVGDLDLVCALPYSKRDLRARLQEVLRCELSDGVRFDAERFRIDAVTHTPRPGLTLFAAGRVDGAVATISVDLTFELDVWPAATRSVVTVERGSAELWTCAPEMIIATKLAVISELGPREWRPKDLADILIAVRRFPPSVVLAETFERKLGTADAGDQILASLHGDRAAMRWGRQSLVAGELEAVIAEVRATLAGTS